MSRALSSKQVIGKVMALVVTLVICWVCWWLWEEIPRLLRRTTYADYGFLISLLGVFGFLSIINPPLRWFWEKFFNDDH